MGQGKFRAEVSRKWDVKQTGNRKPVQIISTSIMLAFIHLFSSILELFLFPVLIYRIIKNQRKEVKTQRDLKARSI
jgi:hypothetical protein